MDKKTSIVLLVVGVVIVALIALAFGLESQSNMLTSEDVLRINNDVYKKVEFENFIKYTLYQNDGKMEIDDEAHEGHDHAAEGTSDEDVFISTCLENFYQLKVYGLLAEDKNIELTSDEIADIEKTFDDNADDITAAGLKKEDYVNFEKQYAVITKVSNSPADYLELPDGVYDEYISQVSGDMLNSYTYRLLQVAYTADKTSGEGSGEVVKGNKEEKEAYMNTLVARLNSGESFETVSESGDNRLIFVGSGLTFGKSPEEYAAEFLLEQKVGKEVYDAMKKTEAGKYTEVVDNGSSFQVVLVSKVEKGVVGKAKEELMTLMISEYASDLIYSYVKDMEVNNAAVTRIKIK